MLSMGDALKADESLLGAKGKAKTPPAGTEDDEDDLEDGTAPAAAPKKGENDGEEDE